MADSAEVRSLEQLELFLEQVQRFRAQLSAEIENLEVELRRLTSWLENDARGYWSDQCVQAQRKLVECRETLSRCMSYVRADEKRPCTEEKKQFRKAQLRQELCEQKLRTVMAAAAHWETERNKTQTKVQRCRDLADSGMMVAIHHLQGQIDTLKTYAGLRSAGTQSQQQPHSETGPAETGPEH